MILNKIHILKHKKNTSQLCDAGIGTYAVATDGSVYPCFMLADQTALSMGNVINNNLFNSEAFNKIQSQTSLFSKITESTCKDCIANTICTGCIGLNFFETGSISIPSEEHCLLERVLLEEILFELIKRPM